MGRSVEIGSGEEGWSGLLEVVVRVRRLYVGGRRAVSWVVKVEMEVEAGVGRERVVGRPRPEKEVRRMLIVGESIIVDVSRSVRGISKSELRWRRE